MVRALIEKSSARVPGKTKTRAAPATALYVQTVFPVCFLCQRYYGPSL